jgi:hypothetical protein
MTRESAHWIRLTQEHPWPPESSPAQLDPVDLSRFVSWLVREGYVESVARLLEPGWRQMSEHELTRLLSSQFSEEQLVRQFLDRYPERVAVKARFRKLNIITAMVIGLFWARENVERGDWSGAIGKFSGVTLSAVVLNRLLYARDPSAAAIMSAKAGRFGAWFQGLARANQFVTRWVRLGLIADIAEMGLSGGGEYPSIPWDIIFDVDIDDPLTWREPPPALINLGFNVWYRQACTTAIPEACGGNLFLGRAEGSLIRGAWRGIMAVGEAIAPAVRD